MQLDKTQIAVRERGLLEILDLALHVFRGHAKPLAAALLLGAAPLLALNHLLIGWMMADARFDETFGPEDFAAVARYIWNMSLLVFIEAPLMSVFATLYLGEAVFLQRPRVGRLASDAWRMAPALAWCQVLLRGAAPAWLLLLCVERGGEFNPLVEALLLPALALYAAFVRSLRPFMNEIILLERNPLRTDQRGAMTIRRRSMLLHNPSSGDLLVRWLGCALICSLLVLTVYGVFLFCSGVLLNDWTPGPILIRYGPPIAMWIVAGYVAVVRFLSYLDLRIRHEGWEVELTLRAEAARLADLRTGQWT